MNLDEVRARLAELATEIAAQTDPGTREVLKTEQMALREQARDLLARLPEGRAMLKDELAALERQLATLEAQKIKKAKISLGGGSPSGGGLEPADVHYLRSLHETRNNVPALRERIEELRRRLLLE
jgi:polyhydroxyalkanoate synthesis regulator phasin